MSKWRERFEDPRAAIGGEAISSDAPAGAPVRDGESFAALEDEFRKLETEGPAAVHWPAVRDRALAILREEGKDLLPACWLAYALFRTEGYQGLATGLVIIDEMCGSYWDALQPPPARARGRAGVFDWLSERLAPLVDGQAPAPSDDIAVAAAFEAAESIAALLDEKLSLDTTMPVLVRALRAPASAARDRLETADTERQRAEEAAAAPPPEPAADGSEADTPGEAASDAGASADDPPAASTPPAGAPTETPAAPKPSPAPASAPAAAPVAVPAVDLASGDAGRAVAQLADAMRAVARMLRQVSVADPRSYTLARTAIWSRVAELPEVDNGRTALPAPDSDSIGFLEQSFAAGSYAAVVEQAEEMQSDSPFWLTASRWSASALRKLGEDHAAAADAVDGQTALFMERFPDIASMSFSNGTPFADADTVTWLSGLKSGGGEIDPTSEATARARALLAGGKGAEAMALLAGEARHASSGRERFSWQLSQAALCLEAGRIAEAVALSDHLIGRAGAVDLADWDPELVAKAAETRLKALQSEAAASVFAEEELARRRSEARVDLVRVDAARAFGVGV